MDESTPTRAGLPWQAIVAATVLALAAAAMVFVYAGSRDDGDSTVEATTDAPALTLRPTDAVPGGDPLDIEFTDVDGTSGTIRDLVGTEPLVVNFFASWCPPCIAEMPDFQAVSRQLGDEVRFFGLAVTDRPEDAARIVDQTGITYPWSRDVRGDIAGAAGITSMPSTMFVSPDGEVVEIRSGAVDEDELRRLIAEHLGVGA